MHFTSFPSSTLCAAGHISPLQCSQFHFVLERKRRAIIQLSTGRKKRADRMAVGTDGAFFCQGRARVRDHAFFACRKTAVGAAVAVTVEVRKGKDAGSKRQGTHMISWQERGKETRPQRACLAFVARSGTGSSFLLAVVVLDTRRRHRLRAWRRMRVPSPAQPPFSTKPFLIGRASQRGDECASSIGVLGFLCVLVVSAFPPSL
jgi:hypothetical protein